MKADHMQLNYKGWKKTKVLSHTLTGSKVKVHGDRTDRRSYFFPINEEKFFVVLLLFTLTIKPGSNYYNCRHSILKLQSWICTVQPIVFGLEKIYMKAGPWCTLRHGSSGIARRSLDRENFQNDFRLMWVVRKCQRKELGCAVCVQSNTW